MRARGDLSPLTRPVGREVAPCAESSPGDIRHPCDADARSCDAIVMVAQRVADDRLYHELTAEPSRWPRRDHGLYAIGGCAGAALIADAVFNGHRLAREIDTEDPSVPLPFIRERRLLDATEEDYALRRG